MKNISAFLLGLLFLAACSAPKYSYHFDHYDYNSGRKKATTPAMANGDEKAPAIVPMDEIVPGPVADDPLILEREDVTASTAVPTPANPASNASDLETFRKKYTEMSKRERREFRKTLKAEVKNYIKNRKSGDGLTVGSTQVMDSDLKLAIIFGAVALTLSFFGGVNSVFWIVSVVSLVIAVVFFIKWLVRQ